MSAAPAPPSAAPSYAAVLRTRYACRTFGAALLGRLSYGMVSLSLILAVKDATGSYAVAGTVMALFGLTSVLLSPARAALVDRHGPRRALLPMAVGYALSLTALAVATSWPGVPGVLLGVLAVPAGVCTPPLGPVMRTLWSDLVPDRALLRRAYSLDAVAEELLFVTGPLLVGVVAQLATPSVGLAVSAVLVLTGSLTLISAPPVRGWKGHGKGSAASAPTGTEAGAESESESEAGVESGAGIGGGRGRRWHGDPRLRQAIAVSASVGICLGAFDLLVIAYADDHGAPGAIVAWALAAMSAGSAVGGLVHGAVPWRVGSGTRLAFLAAALGATLIATGFSPHPAVLVAGAAIGGLFISPALTTAYLIADEAADPATRTTAGAWVNTALNAGSSGATAAAGLVVGRLPLTLCFALAAVPVLLSAMTSLRAPRRRRASPPGPRPATAPCSRSAAR
ncbi:MFS transporter [Streptomyces sp. NPDC020875]|uniref:MFS transporter n=1 Tax=Streptomyces sp. NPDC020875 TaxID=3154898 RepID=UPI0033C78819